MNPRLNKIWGLWLLLYLLLVGVCLHAQKQTFIEESGDVIQIALPAGAFVSSIFDKSGDKAWLQFTQSMALSFGTTHLMKRIVDKERPTGGRHSFPSGHTSAAFTGATFIHIRYGWKYGIPSYLLAAYTGYSRVYSDHHYTVDVVAGAVLGTASALLFTKKQKENKPIFSLAATSDFYIINVVWLF